ncbi:MAG: Thermoresistant gluconokinase [Verrucomicrobiota bacterium]|jgi:gluconokinase
MSHLILIMGVAGSGKSTIGRQLANEMGWPYHEADDFHSDANKAKMAQGIPLDDHDRAPWLASIRTAMESSIAAGQSAVFTCSALKEKYRQILCDGLPQTRLVYLSGSRDLLLARLQGRSGHYMKPEMLASQLAALEPPAGALTLDIGEPPEKLVAQIRREFGL